MIDAGAAVEAVRLAGMNNTEFPCASLAGSGLAALLKDILIASVEPLGGGKSRLVLSPAQIVVGS